jgi:tripartite-type tricarboxylate transporter receptor subunit TctC
MLTSRRSYVVALLLSLVGSLPAAGEAAGQEAAYPTKPVRLVVPFAAGGYTDAIARVAARGLEARLGQPVVVANITGASGTVGAREARGAPPDGYTLFMTHDYLHATFHAGIGQVSHRDFEPICRLTLTPSAVVTHPERPWKSLRALVEAAKATPGTLSFAVTLGGTTHIFAERLAQAAGLRWRYVPYDGIVQGFNALLGGHVDVATVDFAQLEAMRAGKVRPLAVATEARHAALPEVPTLREQGIDLLYAAHHGLLAPKGTPAAALAKVESACAAVAADPGFQEAMRRVGTDVPFLDRAAYAAYLDRLDAQIAATASALGVRR